MELGQASSSNRLKRCHLCIECLGLLSKCESTSEDPSSSISTSYRVDGHTVVFYGGLQSVTVFRGDHCLEMETSGGQGITVFDQGTKQPSSSSFSSPSHHSVPSSPPYMEAQVVGLHTTKNE